MVVYNSILGAAHLQAVKVLKSGITKLHKIRNEYVRVSLCAHGIADMLQEVTREKETSCLHWIYRGPKQSWV